MRQRAPSRGSRASQKEAVAVELAGNVLQADVGCFAAAVLWLGLRSSYVDIRPTNSPTCSLHHDNSSTSHAYLAPPRCHTAAVAALPALQACLHTAALVDPLLLHLRASWGTWLQPVTSLKGQAYAR